MGLEFSVTKELASASATIIELVSVTKAIQTQLGNNDFVASFNGIMVNLSNCYSVIEDNFYPGWRWIPKRPLRLSSTNYLPTIRRIF